MNGGRLGVGGALAGLAGSYLGLVVTVLAMTMNPLLPIAVAAATPVWLVGVLVLGLPAAGWIERRLPPDASFARRYSAYVLAGLASAGLLVLLVLLVFGPGAIGRWVAAVFVVCTVGSALGGRAGVDGWRRYERVRADRTG